MPEPALRLDVVVNTEAMAKVGEALAEMVRAFQRVTFPDMPVIATWHIPADYDAIYARLTERPVERARRLRIERWQRRRARREHRKAPR